MQAIRELKQQEMHKGFKDQNEKIAKEMENTNKEIQLLREETKKKEEEWKKEKQMLENRIVQMEEKMEWNERQNKRNNIIIKTAKISEDNIPVKVKHFLKNDIKVESEVIEAYEIKKE